eukprot:PLAT7480.2.p1 GENE.PLAT7480.2~~PLAT7480.2.p1  ORF type:complete len:220 (-),score=49.68 PLAT7480.2:7-666(-)
MEARQLLPTAAAAARAPPRAMKLLGTGCCLVCVALAVALVLAPLLIVPGLRGSSFSPAWCNVTAASVAVVDCNCGQSCRRPTPCAALTVSVLQPTSAASASAEHNVTIADGVLLYQHDRLLATHVPCSLYVCDTRPPTAEYLAAVSRAVNGSIGEVLSCWSTESGGAVEAIRQLLVTRQDAVVASLLPLTFALVGCSLLALGCRRRALQSQLNTRGVQS